MHKIVVALAQINVTVGALMPNAAKIIRCAGEAAARGASVIAFPELCLSGYPPEDLILKKHFLEDCEVQLQRLARELPPRALVIVGSPRLTNGRAHNAAVLFHGGRIAGSYSKMSLPNYGVFDEKRVFTAGARAIVIQAGPARLGLHICEDSWDTTEKACADLKSQRLDALVNISASPYHRGKLSLREEALGETAAFLRAPVLYCNLKGGQDELVFDGASLAIGPDRKLIARAKQFAEDMLYIQLPVRGGKAPSPAARGPRVLDLPLVGKEGARVSKDWKHVVQPALDDLAEIYAALKLGLRDYVDKNGFAKVIVALSGGIDSAFVAALAVDALGKKRVVGVTMPSPYSSKGTLGDAGKLARNLDIPFHTVPITRLYDVYLKDLAPLWAGRQPDSTEENIQARIRGNIVMALSNKFEWLVLTTGNKSEFATGYCTLYGDMAGGFAVIKDVPKTLIFELARWRNAHGPDRPIPESTIERTPSAELRPDQKDSDTLPPYDVLDPILERYVERDLGVDEIIAEGFDPAVVRRVARMVDHNEYKRRQGPPGIKITPKAFGRDRRMPITNLYDERIRKTEAG